jgi:aldehyde:ferredoxin oxidoreductase
MPQRMMGIALTFATSNRGACHKRAPIGPELMGAMPMEATEGKPGSVKEIQDLCNAIFTLVSCRFAEFCLPRENFIGLLNSATGLSFDEESFLRLGERLWNLERLFNLKAGISPNEDRLPDRCYEPLGDVGPTDRRLRKEDVEKMLREYYDLRGWSESGIPRPETLRRLGLEG